MLVTRHSMRRCGVAELKTALDVRVVEMLPPSIFKKMIRLDKLDCSYIRGADLRPLSVLSWLRVLDCSHSDVVDLAPVAHLTSLTMLDCSHTAVASLAPLAGLDDLRKVVCRGCLNITCLDPLANLFDLETIDCSHTNVDEERWGAWLSRLQPKQPQRAPVPDKPPINHTHVSGFLDQASTPHPL